MFLYTYLKVKNEIVLYDEWFIRCNQLFLYVQKIWSKNTKIQLKQLLRHVAELFSAY